MPERLWIVGHWQDPREDGADTATHVVEVGDEGSEIGKPAVEVTIEEVGLVEGDKEFSTIHARRLGAGAIRLIERSVTPPLRELEEIEHASLQVAAELLAE